MTPKQMHRRALKLRVELSKLHSHVSDAHITQPSNYQLQRAQSKLEIAFANLFYASRHLREWRDEA